MATKRSPEQQEFSKEDLELLGPLFDDWNGEEVLKEETRKRILFCIYRASNNLVNLDATHGEFLDILLRKQMPNLRDFYSLRDKTLISAIESLLSFAKEEDILRWQSELPLLEPQSIDDLVDCLSVHCEGYATVSKLGQGAHGSTYKLYSPEMGMHLAIKVIPDKSSISVQEAKLMAKFLREAPNYIVQIHAAGPFLATLKGQECYAILMEYVDGMTLDEMLKLRWFMPKDILRCSAQLLQGIQELRYKGVTHTDLNLKNIKVTRQKRIKILDFGSATDSPNTKQKDARRFGTPSTLNANDVFSCGLIIYKMLTKKHLIYHREQEMPSSDYADTISRMKEELLSDGKVAPDYRRKIEKLPFNFFNPEGVREIQDLILYCLESQNLDIVKSIHPVLDVNYLENKEYWDRCKASGLDLRRMHFLPGRGAAVRINLRGSN